MAKPKKKRELSPEVRQKLSDLAKQRHAEGRLGGKEFGKMGGRPRKDRATKRVAQAAQEDENARAIIKVFKDAVDEKQPMGIRLKGAEAWMQAEQQEAKLSIQEEEASAKQHTREELIQILAGKLTAGPTANILKRQLNEVTGDVVLDAEVVDE